jgi:hypothetical protein
VRDSLAPRFEKSIDAPDVVGLFEADDALTLFLPFLALDAITPEQSEQRLAFCGGCSDRRAAVI